MSGSKQAAAAGAGGAAAGADGDAAEVSRVWMRAHKCDQGVQLCVGLSTMQALTLLLMPSLCCHPVLI